MSKILHFLTLGYSVKMPKCTFCFHFPGMQLLHVGEISEEIEGRSYTLAR